MSDKAQSERLLVNMSAQTDRLVKLEGRLAEAASLFRRMWRNDQALGHQSYCKVFMTAAHELLVTWAEVDSEKPVDRCEECRYVCFDDDCQPFPWYCTCEESMLHDSVTDPDFACNRWAKR